MLKIENSEVLGWEHAIRGMRNPMNSWDQSDSDEEDFAEKPEGSLIVKYGDEYNYFLGPNDQSLMMQLRNHKLDEWHVFCDWIENLPYSQLITGNVE